MSKTTNPFTPASPPSHPDMKHIQKSLPTITAACSKLGVANEGEETTVTHFLTLCTTVMYLRTLLEHMTDATVITQVDEQKNKQQCSHKGATSKMVSAAVDQYAGTIGKRGIIYDALSHVLANCKGLGPHNCWTAPTGGVQLQLADCFWCECQAVEVITPGARLPFKQLLAAARAQLRTPEEWANQLNTDNNLATPHGTALGPALAKNKRAAPATPASKQAAPATPASKKSRTSSWPSVGASSLSAAPCTSSSGAVPGAYSTGMHTPGANTMLFGLNGLIAQPGIGSLTNPMVFGLPQAPGGDTSGHTTPFSNPYLGLPGTTCPAGTSAGAPSSEPGPMSSMDLSSLGTSGSLTANMPLLGGLGSNNGLEEDEVFSGPLPSGQSLARLLADRLLAEQGNLLPSTSDISNSDDRAAVGPGAHCAGYDEP